MGKRKSIVFFSIKDIVFDINDEVWEVGPEKLYGVYGPHKLCRVNICEEYIEYTVQAASVGFVVIASEDLFPSREEAEVESIRRKIKGFEQEKIQIESLISANKERLAEAFRLLPAANITDRKSAIAATKAKQQR